MTSPTGYATEQALARDLPIYAVIGGASVCWAHVRGVSVDCPPEQVRAEGIHLSDRSVWSLNLGDITCAGTKLIEHPENCAEASNVSDYRALPYGSATLIADRARCARRVADLAQTNADYSLLDSLELTADLIVEVEVCGEVVR